MTTQQEKAVYWMWDIGKIMFDYACTFAPAEEGGDPEGPDDAWLAKLFGNESYYAQKQAEDLGYWDGE